MGLIDNRDAQFMLLAGFIIAIGLVITTVMLNNIIFQANIAGEAGSDPVKYDVVNLMQISSDEMRNAYRNSTALGGTAAQINFSRQMQNFSANLSKIYALQGEGVSISIDISNWNINHPADFTQNGTGGASPWTVIQNVSSSNITVDVITPPLNIDITNAGTSYTYSLSSPGIYNINSANISSHIAPPYSIIFINGAGAEGKYSINGTASGRAFIRARDYILYDTMVFSTGKVTANITIPVSVPW